MDERTATVLPRVKAWNEGLIKAVIKKDRIRKGVYGKLRVSVTLLSEQNFCSCMIFFMQLPIHRDCVA